MNSRRYPVFRLANNRGYPFIHRLERPGHASLPRICVATRDCAPRSVGNLYQRLRTVVLSEDTERHEVRVVFEEDGCFRSPRMNHEQGSRRPVDISFQDRMGVLHPVEVFDIPYTVPTEDGDDLPILVVEPKYLTTLLPTYCEETPAERARLTEASRTVVRRAAVEEQIAHAIAEGATCPISLNPLQKETTAVTVCHHLFDREALARWMCSHTTCPVCRCSPVEMV